MSSNEDDYNDGDSEFNSQSAKKRRIQRACDNCRKKKIKCNGTQMPGNKCTNCVTFSFDCTYVEVAKKRGPPKGYVESLENRLGKLENLLRKLCPDDSILRQIDTSIESGESLPTEATSVFTDRKSTPPSQSDPKDIATSIFRNLNADDPSNLPDEDDAHFILADNLKCMSLDPVKYRFFGKSSGVMLIQTAMELKNEYTGSEHDFRQEASLLGKKREEFWSQHPWESSSSHAPRTEYTLPDPDLLDHLVENYFNKVNIHLPLLHRPSFERAIREGRHLNHSVSEGVGFAGVLLLVCAVGARYTSDPRVLLDGESSFHSAGWKWFKQVQMVRKSLLAPPSLYDLQYYCLSVQFLQGSSAPQSCWTMVGIGIRLGQDVGAHRKRANKTPSADDELWKRAFWVLVCMDRSVSAALGRPCAIQDEDFDLEMPIECNDEYWDTECDDPDKVWKQPPGKPSLITAFNVYLKLNQILAFSLRTIYSINKSKILLGFVGPQWEQHIVAELDSTLNKWVDSIPPHLRWDPTRKNDIFFAQSAVLYCSYYHIQILIHRPFIPSPNNPSPLSFPSLAICTNAARSCSHVAHLHYQRNSELAAPVLQMAVFTSGVVLLLSIWGGKRSGLSTDPNKEMVDVHKCMSILRSCEKQWHSAGRLWDILYELASVGDLPLPQPSPPSNKRDRDCDSPMSSPTALTESGRPDTPQSATARPVAGSRRVQKETIVGGRHPAIPVVCEPTLRASSSTQSLQDGPYQHQLRLQPSTDSLHSLASSSHHHSQPSPAGPNLSQPPMQHPPSDHNLFSLPVYSQDLGKLPLHGQLEFSSMGVGQSGYWYNSLQAPDLGDKVIGNPSSSVLSPPSSARSSISSANFIRPEPAGLGPMSPAGTPMNTNTSSDHSNANRRPSFSVIPGQAGVSGSGSISSNLNSGGLGYCGQQAPSQRAGSIQFDHGSFSLQAQASGSGQRLPQQPPSQLGQPHPQPYMSSMQQQHQPGYVDSDTMAMWSNAPTGFELDEWGTYLMNVSEMTHGTGANSFEHGQAHGS